MLIFKCDWCGRTISDAQGMGVYTTQLKSLGLPSKSLEILSNGKHICETCMEKAGIMMLDGHAIKEGATTKRKAATQKPETVVKTASDPSGSKEPTKTKDTDDVPTTAPGTNDANSDENSEKVDVDKILTLRKAGWRVKEIAEDMHLEPQKISNILYQIRHNKPDKWKAFGLPL